MAPRDEAPRIDLWQTRGGDVHIPAGSQRELFLEAGESYSGMSLRIPVVVWRGSEEGPTGFLTGAIHGDELNGTGTIREILVNPPFDLLRGTLILVPVVNTPGFERHSRYMPDRRDLNRSFPGRESGSLTSRLAHVVFREVVLRSDFGIDLHSAAVRRTNFPNLRADLSDPGTAELAKAFGASILVDASGPEGSFRREAVAAGCPTILLEAGEVWKVEPSIVEASLRGIRNVLIQKGMIEGTLEAPAYSTTLAKSRWVRAGCGGFLQFHVAPGDVVEEDDPIATNASLMGQELEVLRAPEAGIVIGMTTLPAVAPGDPVCHLGEPRGKGLQRAVRAQDQDDESLHQRLRDDLAANLLISDPKEPGDD